MMATDEEINLELHFTKKLFGNKIGFFLDGKVINPRRRQQTLSSIN
jgi:hypothetical protein